MRKNVIFERARFNRRYQQAGESAEHFIMALYELAENCNYGALKSEMIRDCLVVLSERLQLDADLDLEKAKKAIRQREAVREQQQTHCKDLKNRARAASERYSLAKTPGNLCDKGADSRNPGTAEERPLSTAKRPALTVARTLTLETNVPQRTQAVIVARRKGTTALCVVQKLLIPWRQISHLLMSHS